MQLLPTRREGAGRALTRIASRSASVLVVLVLTACALIAFSLSVDAGSARDASTISTETSAPDLADDPSESPSGSTTGAAVDEQCISFCVELREPHAPGIAIMLALVGMARPTSWRIVPSSRSSDAPPPDLGVTGILPPRPDLTIMSVCVR